MQIEIIKQPLYGTVVWTGYSFVYTPNDGFIGNDSYIYKKTEGGKSVILTNYVNPTNIPPSLINIILSADAYSVNVYNISSLCIDNTNPFNELKFTKLSKPSQGTAYFDDSNIYYISNNYNTVESLSFSVTDKQFIVTGVVTLSVFNGLERTPFYQSPENRFLTLSGQIHDVSTQSAYWDEAYNNLYDNYNTWIDINSDRYNQTSTVVEDNSASWIDFDDVKINFISNYKTLTTYAADWTNLILPNINLNEISANWDSVFNTLTSRANVWDSDISILSSLSSSIFNFDQNNNSVYTTVANLSSNWDILTIIDILTTNSVNWDSTYDILFTDNKKDLWDSNFSLTTAFSSVYSNDKFIFDNTVDTVNLYESVWSGTTIKSNLSSNSAYWESLYDTLSSLSGNWIDSSNYKKEIMFSTVTSHSAEWNDEYTLITTKSAQWNTNGSALSLSADYLTGGNTYDLSARDLTVYGNTHIFQNLSALSGSLTFNTSVYTTSSFVIYNEGTSDALTVDKNGYNAIANFQTPSANVLYVKADNTVGVNTSATSVDLTVVGDISADGYILPLYSLPLTVFGTNSAKYEGTYSYLHTNSANIGGLTGNKTNYDEFSNYVVAQSANINNLISKKTNFDNLYTTTKSQSAKNNTTNNFVTLCGANFGIDTAFRSNSAKYDSLYNTVTSLSTLGSNNSIQHLFSYRNVITTPQSAYFIVQDDIKITSWSMYSNVNTVATFDILSCSYSSFPMGSSIVGNNAPHLDLTSSNKNRETNLEGHWVTNISKDTILQFILTTNTAASSILINLGTQKL